MSIQNMVYAKLMIYAKKRFSNVTRQYYVLHPLKQSNLTISTPIDNDKVVMLKALGREEAEEILESFQLLGIDWIADVKLRSKKYSSMVQTGNRKVIASIANTLMRKNLELKSIAKKMYDQDRRLLITIQNILFTELAMALNTTLEEITDRVNELIQA